MSEGNEQLELKSEHADPDNYNINEDEKLEIIDNIPITKVSLSFHDTEEPKIIQNLSSSKLSSSHDDYSISAGENLSNEKHNFPVTTSALSFPKIEELQTFLSAKFIEASFALSMNRHLVDLYNSKNITDIVVECGNETFDLHSVVLSHGSGYFQEVLSVKKAKHDSMSSIFDDHIVESMTDYKINDSTNFSHSQYLTILKLDFSPEISPSCFKILIESLYTGSLKNEINDSNALSLFYAAYHLKVERALKYTVAYLLDMVSVHNCLDVWLASTACNNQLLRRKSIALIGRHLPEISSEEPYLQLELEQVVDMLLQDNLQISNEQQVYDAAMQWILHDENHRKAHLNQLLSSIRFNHLTVRFLTDHVAVDPLIVKDYDAMTTYSNALRFKLAKGVSPIPKRHSFIHAIHAQFEKIQEDFIKHTQEQKIDNCWFC